MPHVNFKKTITTPQQNPYTNEVVGFFTASWFFLVVQKDATTAELLKEGPPEQVLFNNGEPSIEVEKEASGQFWFILVPPTIEEVDRDKFLMNTMNALGYVLEESDAA